MNINELCVLNRAIDGDDIFSLPSFSELRISDFLADAIKESLINKGILENKETLTKEGVLVTNRIRLFKQAKKHAIINNVSVGIINENESILILYNPLKDDYKIRMADTSEATMQIVEACNLLLYSDNTSEVDDGEGMSLSRSDFSREFNPKTDKYLRLKVKDNYQDKSTDEMYFCANGKLHVYDYSDRVLRAKTNEQIIKQINERMSVL